MGNIPDSMSVLGARLSLTTPAVVAPPLRVAFSWTLAGNVVYSGCMWGMVLVLAKLGSPRIVGQFALGMAIAAPIFMFTNLQLRAVQATDSCSEFEFAHYFTLRCLATLVGLAAVVGLVFASSLDPVAALVVLLAASARVVESLSDVVAGLLQKIERPDQLAKCMVFKGITSLIAFTGIFWRFRNLAAALLAMGLVWLLVFLAYELGLATQALGKHAVLFQFNVPVLKRLLRLSLPLGLVMALGSLYTNIPRYVLEHYRGPRELGIFASLAYLGTSALVVITALGQSATARLSRMFAERQFDAFASLIRKFVLLGVLLGIIGVPLGALLGQPLISALYRPEYAQYLDTFLVMIATTSVLAVASMLGYGVTAARSFRLPVLIVFASVAATALCSTLLVPKFGLMGATLALLIASVIYALGLAVLLKAEIGRARRMAHSPSANATSPEIHKEHDDHAGLDQDQRQSGLRRRNRTHYARTAPSAKKHVANCVLPVSE
jgi:O-antigen/teichoic acid export membrane protein